MTTEIPQGVGWTALVVAAQRAQESRRPDALFHDPLAERLVAQVGEGAHGDGDGHTPPLRVDADGEPTPMSRMMGDYLPVRTRFFDERLLAAAEGIDQVVVLAAGLDGRAFRLGWPAGTRVFELDRDEVLAFKATVADALVPAAEYRTVAVDLREDWPTALVAAGFDPARRTVWLAEGLLIYLPADANDALMRRVADLSAPGSRLLTEWSDGDPSASMDERLDPELLTDPAVSLFRDLVDEGPAAPPRSLLARYGWVPEVTTVAEAAEHYGRAAPPVMDERRDGIEAWLVDARR